MAASKTLGFTKDFLLKFVNWQVIIWELNIVPYEYPGPLNIPKQLYILGKQLVLLYQSSR